MWLTLTLSSFALFLGSMLALIRRGFAPDGSFRRAGTVFILVAALSAAVWAYSLSQVPPPYALKNLGRYERPKFPIPPVKKSVKKSMD